MGSANRSAAALTPIIASEANLVVISHPLWRVKSNVILSAHFGKGPKGEVPANIEKKAGCDTPSESMHTHRANARAKRKRRTPQSGIRLSIQTLTRNLFRQRVRTILDVDHLALLALAAFKVRLRAARVLRPQALALPAGARIVDAPVKILRIEAHRIGHPHDHPLAVDERVQGVGIVAGHDGNVLAKSERIVLVDPDIIRGFCGRARRAL